MSERIVADPPCSSSFCILDSLFLLICSFHRNLSMTPLLTILAASLDMLIQLPASFLVSGLIMRWHRGEPFELFDLGSIVVIVLCLGFLIRRMHRSPVRSLAGIGRSYRLPEGTVGPTASWAHFLFDALFLWFGIIMWDMTVATPSGMVEEPGPGRGFVIVSIVLVLVRIFYRIRHRDSPENL
jgi:hypothetical protein